LILSVAVLLILVGVYAMFGQSIALIAGMAALGAWCAIRPNDNRRIKVFLFALTVPVVMLAIRAVLNLVNALSPMKYDIYLHAIDHTLGFCPSQVAARLVAFRPGLYGVVVGIYQIMLPMMVTGYGWALYGKGHSARLLGSYAVSTVSAPLYLIVPASGPGFLLGRALITGHPAPQIALIHLNYVANCIPSAHLSAAICIWFFNRSNQIASKASLAFVFATAFATLALGEHYLIDLVLSFPFALFAISVVSGQYRRAGISLLVVVTWLMSIRLAIHSLLTHPVLLWAAAAVTIGASCAYLSRPPQTAVEAKQAVAFPASVENGESVCPLG
jgi:hypothetical protein